MSKSDAANSVRSQTIQMVAHFRSTFADLRDFEIFEAMMDVLIDNFGLTAWLHAIANREIERGEQHTYRSALGHAIQAQAYELRALAHRIDSAECLADGDE